MFENLPVKEEEDVEPLTILPLPRPKEQEKPEKSAPQAGKQIPLTGGKGEERGRKHGSSTPKKESTTPPKTLLFLCLLGWPFGVSFARVVYF